jgi:hypothetical protein
VTCQLSHGKHTAYTIYRWISENEKIYIGQSGNNVGSWILTFYLKWPCRFEMCLLCVWPAATDHGAAASGMRSWMRWRRRRINAAEMMLAGRPGCPLQPVTAWNSFSILKTAVLHPDSDRSSSWLACALRFLLHAYNFHQSTVELVISCFSDSHLAKSLHHIHLMIVTVTSTCTSISPASVQTWLPFGELY